MAATWTSDEQCMLCDEGNDPGEGLGEFWDAKQSRSIVAHEQCGIDAGLPLA